MARSTTTRKHLQPAVRLATAVAAALAPVVVSAALVACAGRSEPRAWTPTGAPAPGVFDDRALATRPAAPPLAETTAQRHTEEALDAHFKRHATRRAYILTDKPLYQPGEAIWFRVDLRETATFLPGSSGVTVKLVSPRGAVVAEKRLDARRGTAHNDFALSPDLEGGEYTLELAADVGATDRRKVIVSTYEAPRLKKELEFLRKAYGPGDAVRAAIKVARATGEPFAGRRLTGVVTVDDAEVARVPVRTDLGGQAVVRFTLPKAIARGDGLLTVLADDGGVTESVQKRIPIVLAKLDLQLLPEGGQLVAGVPGRVYFRARNPLGKPADIEGRIVDEAGREVTTFRSLRDGFGRFDLTPALGRRYEVRITRPAGIEQPFVVPGAARDGCVLRALPVALDADELRAAIWCGTGRTVLVEAAIRERRVGGGTWEVEPRKPTVVALPMRGAPQGVVRVTLFDAGLGGSFREPIPLAERLVYHGRGRDLRVEIRADRARYTPRDPVTLTVKTTDPAGKPVAADLGLAVVDDTVLSFADDKSARILARMYLEPEIPGLADDPIEEPNRYFARDPEAAQAMDLLLATRGWRRFDWQLVFNPPPPPPAVDAWDRDEMVRAVPMAAEAAPAEAPVRADAPRDARQGRAAPQAGPPRPRLAGGEERGRLAAAGRRAGAAKRRIARPDVGEGVEGGVEGGAVGGAVGGDAAPGWQWSPVRVFPAVAYREKRDDGPRNDFRETIHWAPRVTTNAAGVGTVTFYLSDAVTSFRVVAEGFSAGGLAGRGQAVLASKLPMALDVRLPLEVSSGDRVLLPVTAENATGERITGTLSARFGAGLVAAGAHPTGAVTLGPGEKRTFQFPLEVVGKDGEGDVEVRLTAAGLTDEVRKKIRIVPPGFPIQVSVAGTLRRGAQQHAVDLTGALPGTVTAVATLYPSPVATMTQGMQGMIQEPGGCFEQTSSNNYPNVMILRYLGAHEAADPELVQRTQGMIERGYKLLAGYETKEKGYEWFGQAPGHEALTAYGLMEFADMAAVYDVDQGMVRRTAAWLLSRRDGKGGFLRNDRALDSFGRASAETTNGYIVWALTEAGRGADLRVELEAQRRVAREAADPYLVALAANSLLNVAKAGADGRAAAGRLVTLQAADGSFAGKESITRSGGASLTAETTALALAALIEASPRREHDPAIRKAVTWLNANRSGAGTWGSTQATILALRALTAYAEYARVMPGAGTAILLVNGREAARKAFERGHHGAIVFDDVSRALVAGRNTIELRLDAEGDPSLPYGVAIEYRAKRPASSPKAPLALTTALAKTRVKAGEGVRLRARIENTRDEGVPMTIARIGLPGGLAPQTWQLEELRDKGIVDFVETRPREVIVYFRALPPKAVKEVTLDLLAKIPGTYTSPASSAYLYYTAEDKTWVPPVRVTVE